MTSTILNPRNDLQRSFGESAGYRTLTASLTNILAGRFFFFRRKGGWPVSDLTTPEICRCGNVYNRKTADSLYVKERKGGWPVSDLTTTQNMSVR